MKWNVKAIAIGILSLLITAPSYAAVSEAEQVAAWRSQLLRSYCAENWTEALSLAAALMGSDVSPHERVWLYLLRQDLFNYQSGLAQFDGCDGSPIVAGVTGSEALAAAESSSLNWLMTNRRGPAIATTLSRTHRSQAATPPSPIAPASEFVRQSADTACLPVYERDRRVANGTISNRWAYEIWQDNGGFRTRFWQQSQTCNQARTTSRYSTQNGAYEAFRNAATYNESQGVIQGN
ncbi:hypothetical protein [Egbenema bharatensis]|uniref:hypothetical protein n=1 Tax=Egbenema bharatensis TaxID=3463334 RepID=UPI003A871D99